MIEWYSYDPERGYETFKTAKEASDDAQACLEHLRDKAVDGWHEDTEAVQWGVMVPLAYAVKTEERPHEDPSFDYWCDFAIETVEEPDNAAMVELGLRTANALGDLHDARAELTSLRRVLRDALDELSSVGQGALKEPGSADLLALIRELKDRLPQDAERREKTLVEVFGFDKLTDEQKRENLLVNLGIAK